MRPLSPGDHKLLCDRLMDDRRWFCKTEPTSLVTDTNHIRELPMSRRLALLAATAIAGPLLTTGCAQETASAAAPDRATIEDIVRDVLKESGPVVNVETSDREAIETVVREYIIANPEIIEEALIELAARERAEMAGRLASDPRDFTLGPDDAKVTIVEFFDYRCGYCKRGMDWLLETAENNPDTVRVVFKEFPILSPESRDAALAALAAGRQGKYTEMHTALMESKSDFSEDAINEIAEKVGVDVKKMRADMQSRELQQQISDVRSQAIEVGAEATPTFFINGRVVAGYDPASLDRIVAEELDEG